MLTGEKLPTYAALATNLLFTAAGISVEENTLAILNLDQAKRIRDSSHENGKKTIVYAAGNYIGQRELTKMGIAFCQLPYSIHER